MLKNKLIKRILLVLSCLFITFIIYIFPTQKEEIKPISKKNNTKGDIIYLKDKNDYISRVSVYIKENNIERKRRRIN